MEMDNRKAYEERVNRLKTAIAVEQPDRVPVAPFLDGVSTRLMGSCYTDHFYNYEKAGQAAIAFFEKYPMVDGVTLPMMSSGIANELAGTLTQDWPGSPSGKVGKYSTHQIIEFELMYQEEYPELLHDYTGFMLRKYIPRAFKNMQALKGIGTISPGLSSGMLNPLAGPDIAECFKLLERIGEENKKAQEVSMKYNMIMTQRGYPGMITGGGTAPYDVLADNYRGTMGIFEDILDEDVLPMVKDAVELFTEMQLKSLAGMKHIPLPFKTCFFPLHKGMDGFLNDKQYEELYWKPLKRLIMALIDIDVIPLIYTEGPYNTRLDFLTDVPKGKVIFNFENVDMKRAKEIVGKNSCIMGNLSISKLEFGEKEDVIRDVRWLLDTCAPGGGYIFDFDGSVENAKVENLDAVFETLAKYGNY